MRTTTSRGLTRWILVVALGTVSACACAGEQARTQNRPDGSKFELEGSLDGTRFEIEIETDEPLPAFGRDGSEEPEESNPWEYSLPQEFSQGSDSLVFDHGSFESRNCSALGFSRTSYSADASGGSITFAARGASDMVGMVEWTGSVADDRIEGEIKWTSLGGTVVYYSFKGKRVAG